MTAKNALRKDQFVEVYRGFAGVSPETLDTGALGRHWSTSKRVAESFAHDWLGPEDSSMVINAFVHKRHIIGDDDPEEWEREVQNYGAFGHGGGEQEYTIRPGAPIHVMGISHWPNEDKEVFTHRKDIPYRQRMSFRA